MINGLIHKAYWISSIIVVHLISGTGSSVPAHRGPVTLCFSVGANAFSDRIQTEAQLWPKKREVTGIEQEQNLLTDFFIELTPDWNDTGAVQKASWGMIGIIAVVVATWMSAARLSFDWRSAALPLAGCLALGGLVWMYSYRRCDERIATSLTGVMQLVAFTATGEILSYLVASTGRPLWDASLFAWDKALGLDWRAYLAFVNERPWLGICYTVAYQSLMPQTIIAVIALGLGGHLLACRRFVAAFILSGLISIVISGAMPAVAMFAYLGLQPQDYPNLHPAAAFVHVAHLVALRDGSMQVISLHDAQGIITFPSYHAALGVIFACSFWSHRWLRWPGVVVNALLIAATPIDGGHYFVDVIAGIIIAIVSLLAICLLADRSQQRASLPRDIAVPGALGAPRSKV